MKLVAFFTALLLLLGCKRKIDIEMPNFDLLLLDSTTVLNTASISAGQPCVFIYFDPDCKGCQHETEDIVKNISRFERVKIYFLTNAPFSGVVFFEKYYNLKRFPNIVVGQDLNNVFVKTYRPHSTPFTVIYNSQRYTYSVFSGMTDSDSILGVLKQLKIEKKG